MPCATNRIEYHHEMGAAVSSDNLSAAILFSVARNAVLPDLGATAARNMTRTPLRGTHL